jgi:hypothetical protein
MPPHSRAGNDIHRVVIPPVHRPEFAMPRRLPRPATQILLATALALLASCGPSKDEFAPVCPVASPLWQAADLVRYRDESVAAHEDVRDMILTGHIVAIPAKCGPGDNKNQLAADVSITIQLTRGPAMQGREADVPLFLAVAEGDQILDKKVFPQHFVFPTGLDQVTWSSDPVHLVFPISATKSGAAYTVLAGFQLTPAELALNRAHAPQ